MDKNAEDDQGFEDLGRGEEEVTDEEISNERIGNGLNEGDCVNGLNAKNGLNARTASKAARKRKN